MSNYLGCAWYFCFLIMIFWILSINTITQCKSDNICSFLNDIDNKTLKDKLFSCILINVKSLQCSSFPDNVLFAMNNLIFLSVFFPVLYMFDTQSWKSNIKVSHSDVQNQYTCPLKSLILDRFVIINVIIYSKCVDRAWKSKNTSLKWSLFYLID